jgi:hypothetical protein
VKRKLETISEETNMSESGNIKRPELNEIHLHEVLDKPTLLVTMSAGQWDELLQAAYDTGATLLELDDMEIPAKAYRREDV